MYYDDRVESLKDSFGTPLVHVEPGRIRVGQQTFPVVDDVIIILELSRLPARLAARIAAAAESAGESVAPAPGSGDFAGDIQFTFGAEWQRFPEILPEHEQEFALYFDLVDIPSLARPASATSGAEPGGGATILPGGAASWSSWTSRRRSSSLVGSLPAQEMP